MSVVIIGGGGAARAAITSLENASLSMTDAQRSQGEKLLGHVTDLLRQFTASPQPPA